MKYQINSNYNLLCDLLGSKQNGNFSLQLPAPDLLGEAEGLVRGVSPEEANEQEKPHDSQGGDARNLRRFHTAPSRVCLLACWNGSAVFSQDFGGSMFCFLLMHYTI